MAITTKALDEAGTRVSRQLLMQSLVNLLYGIAAGVGLSVIGVPYALLWAALGAALRFIPYVGPVLAAGAPILVSLAALDGWTGALETIALFGVSFKFDAIIASSNCDRSSIRCRTILRLGRREIPGPSQRDRGDSSSHRIYPVV